MTAVRWLGERLARLRGWAYSGFGRDRWQQPDRIMDALRIAPGAAVADIGSGGGYFTFRLAEAVGPTGRVFAVDVDHSLLADVASAAGARGLDQVRPVEAEPGLPHLPEPIDMAFVSNAYHHIPDQPRYFAALAAFLRPGGRVAIIESRGEGLLRRFFGHATAPERIEREMRQAGYTVEATHDIVGRQSFQVFRR
jgi:arsenite methyltransferase